jgi:NADH-quinone oxidoreductase subunit J
VDVVIQAIFLVAAALIVGAALMVVVARNLIHAALWLISSFFGVGIIYLLLQAEFLAIVQVLIYVGAVSVLVLFAIMLTRQVTRLEGSVFYSRWWGSLAMVVALFGGILVPTLAGLGFVSPEQQPGQPVAAIGGTQEIGVSFVTAYLLPFQMAAVLLLIALVGAIVVTFEERRQRRRVLTLAERYALQREQQQAQMADPDDTPPPDSTGDGATDTGAGNGREPQDEAAATDDDAVIRNIPR